MKGRGEVTDDLKRYAPAGLKVTLLDGTEKAVAVPKNGNRWARTQQVLDSLSWVRIECLDKDGKVLGIIEDETEDELQDEEVEGSTALARVMMEVQRSTMREVRQMFDVTIRGFGHMLASLAEGQRAQADAYQTALEVQRAHLMAPPSMGEGESKEVFEMLRMAMAMKAMPTKGGG